jgi:hypothetical protein
LRSKRKRLPDKLEASRRVGREDQDVLARAGVEVGQYRPSGALELPGHCRGGWVVGVRIAKDAGAQKTHVLFKLRLGKERTAGVIEVNLALLVESAVLGGAQPVQRGGTGVGGIAPSDVSMRGLHLRFTLGGAGCHTGPLIRNLHFRRSFPQNVQPLRGVKGPKKQLQSRNQSIPCSPGPARVIVKSSSSISLTQFPRQLFMDIRQNTHIRSVPGKPGRTGSFGQSTRVCRIPSGCRTRNVLYPPERLRARKPCWAKIRQA